MEFLGHQTCSYYCKNKCLKAYRIKKELVKNGDPSGCRNILYNSHKP